MSAGDWVRIQRLKGSVNYAKGALVSNVDVKNPVSPKSNPFNPTTDISRVVGSSKTRRETSKWTDYIAATHADYITFGETNQTYPALTTARSGRQLNRSRICTSCVPTVLNTKVGKLQSSRYQHLRM